MNLTLIIEKKKTQFNLDNSDKFIFAKSCLFNMMSIVKSKEFLKQEKSGYFSSHSEQDKKV